MTAPRLTVDIERRLATFSLVARLEIGTEVLVLFGPSGSGKTTTLNAIAGLVRPDAGEIALDGVTFFRRGRPGPAVHLPARRRRIGYVFQQYALFPHLTAVQNAAYGLWRQRDARARALDLLERVGIAHLADHYPHELSGGQQQRVAIARALAPAPPVLLLDEPFSALDAAVRERLQRDLAALQRDLGLVVVYVTHRLEDAMALGHRLAIVREGRVEQIGPIDEVTGQPASREVATLLGIRNLFAARVVASGPEALTLDWDGLRLEAPPRAVAAGTMVTAYIRPEDIKVLYPDRPVMRAVSHNQAAGTIVTSQRRAQARTLTVRLAANGREIEIQAPGYAYAELPLLMGEQVQVALRKEALVVVRDEDAERVGPAPRLLEEAGDA